MTVRESVVRDHFAARYAHPRIEHKTEFGRIDVVVDGMAVEVEPVRRWRHGVRQAFAYSKETGLAPALALYGDVDARLSWEIYRLVGRRLALFMLHRRRWYRVASFEQADRAWAAPPDDLSPIRYVRPSRRESPTRDADMRRAVAAMDAAMETGL
jgi:hypothetical protein